jgi:hypothetical protein
MPPNVGGQLPYVLDQAKTWQNNKITRTKIFKKEETVPEPSMRIKIVEAKA